MAARKKVGELQDYKDRRRRQREINNLEERILLDQISDGQKRKPVGISGAVGNCDRLPLAKDKDVRQLQIEYERAREGGKHAVTFAPHRRARNPSYFTEPEVPRYNPHQDPKVQQLAETHGRHMEYLQGKNRELERQREEIRRRLEELGRRPPVKDNSNNDDLLRELRDQEARNQHLLNELRLQLVDARRPVNIIQQHPQQDPPAAADKKTFIYPVYYGNSLVAEIVAVRQAYLQNGGNDPDILAQLAQMQAEAQAIDDSMRNVQKRHPKDKKDGSSHLSILELENERLQRQLMLLQEQKVISTTRRKDNREGRTTPTSVSPPHPQKEPNTRQSVSKWMQTNPVPPDEADASGLPQTVDYKAQRQHAKHVLQDRWGPQTVKPTPIAEKGPVQSTSTSQIPSKGKGKGRVDRPPENQNSQETEDEQVTVDSLQPGRRETVQQAANSNDYMPDEPLDIDQTALRPRKKTKARFPHKLDIGPMLNENRAVIVKSEKPYGYADFYGRPVDENGKLLDMQRKEILLERLIRRDLEQLNNRRKGSFREGSFRQKDDAREKQRLKLGREDQLPSYKTYQFAPQLVTYDFLLKNMFKRSDALIRYDPYYYSTRYKHSRNVPVLDVANTASKYPTHRLAKPSLTLVELERENSKPDIQGTSQTSDAAAQTNPEDRHENQPGPSKRAPPPTQRPADTPQNAQPVNAAD